MYWNVVNRFGGQALYRRLLLVLRQVADKHGCSVANVALRWGLASAGCVVVASRAGYCLQPVQCSAGATPSCS